MLFTLALELCIGCFGIYVGLVAYSDWNMPFALSEVVFASLAVFLALQNILMYKSYTVISSRVFMCYLTVLKYIAKIGTALGFVLSVAEIYATYHEYTNGHRYVYISVILLLEFTTNIYF